MSFYCCVCLLKRQNKHIHVLKIQKEQLSRATVQLFSRRFIGVTVFLLEWNRETQFLYLNQIKFSIKKVFIAWIVKLSSLRIVLSRCQLFVLSNSSVYVEGPGGHASRYSIKWLTENTYQEVKRKTVQPRILWNTDIYKNANIASAKWDTFMKCDAELKAFLQIHLLYGIAFVDGVPATVEATEALCERVSLIRYVYASCYTFIVRSHFHKAP